MSRTFSVSLLSMLVVPGCNEQKPQPDYPVSLKIYGDPGQALPGAKVALAGRSYGTSDADGRIALSLRGNEGQVLAFQVSCPEGYRAPPLPISVVLRRVSENDRRPEYEAHCQPLLRTLVVAIRAEHGANLPVLYLGHEVARTDRAGAAHFLVRTPPEDTVELTFDTSKSPELRPHNPSARFQIGNHDEVFVLDQTFQVAPRPKPPKIRREPGIINIRGH